MAALPKPPTPRPPDDDALLAPSTALYCVEELTPLTPGKLVPTPWTPKELEAVEMPRRAVPVDEESWPWPTIFQFAVWYALDWFWM